jgi:hypothetical protein
MMGNKDGFHAIVSRRYVMDSPMERIVPEFRSVYCTQTSSPVRNQVSYVIITAAIDTQKSRTYKYPPTLIQDPLIKAETASAATKMGSSAAIKKTWLSAT